MSNENESGDTTEKLTAEQRLLIGSEVEIQLKKYAKIFGVANLVVILGAIWAAYAAIPKLIDTRVDKEIEQAKQKMNAAQSSADQFIGEMKHVKEEFDSTRLEVQKLKSNVEFIQDQKNIEAVKDILDNWDQTDGVAKFVSITDNKIKSDVANCERPRLFFGEAKPEDLDFKEYLSARKTVWPDAMTVVVDTSIAEFKSFGTYFVNLNGGSGIWEANGANAINDPKPSSFKLALRMNRKSAVTEIVPYAKRHKWQINWLGIGC